MLKNAYYSQNPDKNKQIIFIYIIKYALNFIKV